MCALWEGESLKNKQPRRPVRRMGRGMEQKDYVVQ